MSRLHIDEVYPKNTSYPMIVTFQNGYATEHFEDTPCLLLEDENTRRKVIVTEIADLIYNGEEEEEETGNTLIVARNRKTGKTRIIEVGNVALKSDVKIDSEVNENLNISNLELSRKFGSKKQKKRMEQHEKLKVNVETVAKQMKNVTKNLSEEQIDLSSYNKLDSDDTYVPPINRKATKVTDVYEIDLILSPEEYEKIHSELVSSEYKESFNPFMKSIINDELTDRQIVLAVYANCLMQLFSTLSRDIIKKSFVISPYSYTLNEIILKNFLSHVNGKRGRPPHLKDKAFCHAIVFILLINNYKFDVDALCKHLKMTAKTIGTKVSVTGATIVTNGTKKIVELKLPLNKPAIRRKSAKF